MIYVKISHHQLFKNMNFRKKMKYIIVRPRGYSIDVTRIQDTNDPKLVLSQEYNKHTDEQLNKHALYER